MKQVTIVTSESGHNLSGVVEIEFIPEFVRISHLSGEVRYFALRTIHEMHVEAEVSEAV